MDPEDIFMGWGFLIFLLPFAGIINGVIALPTTILVKAVNKQAGLIAWIATTLVTCAYGIYSYFNSWQNSAQYLMIQSVVEYVLFFVIPQATVYPLTRNRPELRPWIAAGLGIGGVILFIFIGVLLGATSD
jgi:hypothetical protein